MQPTKYIALIPSPPQRKHLMQTSNFMLNFYYQIQADNAKYYNEIRLSIKSEWCRQDRQYGLNIKFYFSSEIISNFIRMKIKSLI